MSHTSVIDRLHLILSEATTSAFDLPRFHREFEAGVEALEGLPWPLVKQGRDLAHNILVESYHDAEQFDCEESRSKLFIDIKEWLAAAREAG